MCLGDFEHLVLNLIEDIRNYWQIVPIGIDKIIVTGAVILTFH